MQVEHSFGIDYGALVDAAIERERRDQANPTTLRHLVALRVALSDEPLPDGGNVVDLAAYRARRAR